MANTQKSFKNLPTQTKDPILEGVIYRLIEVLYKRRQMPIPEMNYILEPLGLVMDPENPGLFVYENDNEDDGKNS